MSKILTAEEYLENEHFNIILDIKDTGLFPEDIIAAMVGFAKIHVGLALKEASESKSLCDFYTEDGLDYKENRLCKYSVLNSYPLDNIK